MYVGIQPWMIFSLDPVEWLVAEAAIASLFRLKSGNLGRTHARLPLTGELLSMDDASIATWVSA
mgnify:FL=1